MFDKEKQLEVINEKIKKLRVDRSKTKNEVRKCEINGEIEKLAKESKNIQSNLKSSKLEDKISHPHPSEIKDVVEPKKEEIEISVEETEEKTVNGIASAVEETTVEEPVEEPIEEENSSEENNTFRYNKKKHKNKYFNDNNEEK